MNTLTIGILGVGWVGGTLARYFEEIRGYRRGENLFLYDIDPAKCAGPHTKGFGVGAGDFNNADIIFVTLPTPRNPKDGSCDTSILESAIPKIKGEKIIVIRSTVLPGTTERLQRQYLQHKFLFNPEFLTESRAWNDMVRPDRQIVGFTEKSLDAAHAVLSLLPKAPFMSPWGMGTYQPTRITATEAEFIKYAGNVHFARKVTFANALAKLAAHAGANYENIRKGMAADHRIGDSHLDVMHGGYRGFGGYCFPKDISALIAFADAAGFNDVATLIRADWDFNEKLLKEQGLTIEKVSAHISSTNNE